MEISQMQSLSTYAKDLELQAQWDMKLNAVRSFTDETSEEQGEDSHADREEKKPDHTLQLIETKLASGKAPTQEEMAYLKEKEPERHEQAVQIQDARSSYEEALKECTSEEDVKQLKMSRLSASIAVVDSIKNNPVIDPDKKLQYIVVEHQKAAAINQITTHFLKRGEYRSLSPEEQETAGSRQKVFTQQLNADSKDIQVTSDSLLHQEDRDMELSEEMIRKVKQAKVKAFYLLYADVYGDGAEEVVLPAATHRTAVSFDAKA